MLRDIWNKMFKQAWIFSLFIFLLLSALRAYGLLSGNKSNYIFVMYGFLIMWFIPAIFLNKNGRNKIGIKKPKNMLWIILSPFLGIFYATIVFLIGYLLFQSSGNNWYVTVGNSYFSDPRMLQMPRFQMFLTFTIPAMLFSPIGEELFFRGVISESFKIKWNLKTGVIVNSALFGLVHILHHGISNQNGSMQILWLSGLLWCVLIFLCGALFSIIREKTGSIWPSMIAHSFFNLTMNAFIFFVLFP